MLRLGAEVLRQLRVGLPRWGIAATWDLARPIGLLRSIIAVEVLGLGRTIACIGVLAVAAHDSLKVPRGNVLVVGD